MACGSDGLAVSGETRKEVIMAKVVWPIILLVAVVVGIMALACEYELDPSLTELEVGDCVAWPSAIGEVEKLEHVDCSEPGALRVTRKFNVSGYDSWPGYSALEATATQQCPGIFPQYLGPSKETWEKAGDREVICFELVR
jgi:hypothetical protein